MGSYSQFLAFSNSSQQGFVSDNSLLPPATGTGRSESPCAAARICKGSTDIFTTPSPSFLVFLRLLLKKNGVGGGGGRSLQ